MNSFEIMATVSYVTSIVTMVLICVAVLPHLKSDMVVVRDTVLWVVFVFVLTGLLVVGVQHVSKNLKSKSSNGPEPTRTFTTSNRYAGK